MSYAARWRRGARRKAQSRGGGEGGMGTGQGLRAGRMREASGHEGVWEHGRNADLWSQSTRTSGQEESISNDTHPTHCSKYVSSEEHLLGPNIENAKTNNALLLGGSKCPAASSRKVCKCEVAVSTVVELVDGAPWILTSLKSLDCNAHRTVTEGF